MSSKNKLSNTLNRMFLLHPKLIDFDLSRLKLLMNKFNNPQNTLKNVIHIAGTNGKGSTASFLKEILERHNLSVNVYTSPHLINFNERIRINNKLIAEDKLIKISIIQSKYYIFKLFNMLNKHDINPLFQKQRLKVRKKRKYLKMPPWLLCVAVMQLYGWLCGIFSTG